MQKRWRSWSEMTRSHERKMAEQDDGELPESCRRGEAAACGEEGKKTRRKGVETVWGE